MKQPTWLLDDVVLALHSMLLSEHGGSSGVRDKTLLDSALARSKQKHAYDPDITVFMLAAAYSFGIAKNHPFTDANKRTAFTVGATFLEINDYALNATEPNAAIVFEQLAAGQISEAELAKWFENYSQSK